MTTSTNSETRRRHWLKLILSVLVLTLLSVLMTSLAGCRRGPKVSWCVIDPSGCVYGNEYLLPKGASNKIACIAPHDVYQAISACRQADGLGKLTFCVWSNEDSYFACSDGSLRGWDEVTNWACLESVDWQRAMEYCARKKSRARRR